MTQTLKPIRQGTTVTMRVTLTDNGTKVSWPDLSSVRAYVYSEEQRLVAGACALTLYSLDDTVLICTYNADEPQYLGMQKCVIVAEFDGQKSTYDKPAFTFVATTAETLSDGTTIADDTTDVDINVEDVSSSILAGAIAAALAAAENANDAADDASDAAAEARAAIAAIPDLSNYYNKSQVDAIADGKQDALESGVNIKTINGESILGGGDLEIEGGGGGDAVKYTEQSLTSEQKAQARTNIGAGTSSFSGSYNDLSNKPSIPTVPTISTDIAADAGSDAKTASPKAVKTFVEGKGYGTYSKPSGGIPATDIASGVIPDVSGKANKVSGATSGNFAGLDSNGDLTDSGKKASDFQTTLTFDNAPTQNSNNPVKSGGVFSALADKQDALVDMTFSTFMTLWNESIAPSS